MKSLHPHLNRMCILALVAAATLVALPSPAIASESCSASVDWGGANAECKWTYPEYQSSSGDGAVWVVKARCDNVGICASYVECEENGERGILSDVLRDGIDVGEVCVPQKERVKVDPGAAAVKFFEDFDWPASTLSVEPPNGRTLVNFETIFYTTNTEPALEQVTLLGQRIVVRATPAAYIWDFGDGEGVETASPGLPYPDQTVVHEYTQLDPVTPSVATVYSGEYQINGGDWEPIDITLTVAGPTEDLQIVEAAPELVEDPNG